METPMLISNNVRSGDNRDGDREFGSKDPLFRGFLIKRYISPRSSEGALVIFRRPEARRRPAIARKSPLFGINLDTLLGKTLSRRRVELQTVRRVVFVNIPDVVHGFLTNAF